MLLACWAVRGAAFEAGPTVATRRCSGCSGEDWRRRAMDEQSKGPIVRTLLLACCQLVRIDCPKPRATMGIHNGHHDLRPTRRIEHNAIQSRRAAAELHELTYRGHLHSLSLPWATVFAPEVGGRETVLRRRELGGAHSRLSTISVARDIALAEPSPNRSSRWPATQLASTPSDRSCSQKDAR